MYPELRAVTHLAEDERMPTQDMYYDAVKNALRKDGWRVTYTDFPLKSRASSHAEGRWDGPLLAAEKDERRVAVAVNSFIGRSNLTDIQQTLQPLAISRLLIHAIEPDRVLYLAIRQATYSACFPGDEGEQWLVSEPLQLLVFYPRTETILQWVARPASQQPCQVAARR
jgi:hypothetical protein